MDASVIPVPVLCRDRRLLLIHVPSREDLSSEIPWMSFLFRFSNDRIRLGPLQETGAVITMGFQPSREDIVAVLRRVAPHVGWSHLRVENTDEDRLRA